MENNYKAVVALNAGLEGLEKVLQSVNISKEVDVALRHYLKTRECHDINELRETESQLLNLPFYSDLITLICLIKARK